MNKLFSIDGLLYKVGTTIIDLFYMNILWLVFTILGLGITGGASTSALFYVMLRRADDKGCCNFKEFFYGFKKNFIKSTKIWLILIGVFAILIVNIEYIPFFKSILMNDYILYTFFAIQLLVMIELIVISIYIFCILTKYDIEIINLFKIAFIFAHKYFVTTITCFALLVVVLIGFFHVPILLCTGISGYAMLSSILLKQKVCSNKILIHNKGEYNINGKI